MIEKDQKKLSTSFEENIAYMEQVLPVKQSYDMLRRDMEIGGRQAVFYFINGFTKDDAMTKLMEDLAKVKEEEMPTVGTQFSRKWIPYAEINITGDFDTVFRNVLSGVTILFIEGYSVCFLVDCRTYPSRSIDEPSKDKSIRGSRDGFVETIVSNTALIRRRIRDPHLIMEITEAGQVTRTDIAVCYMSDRVDQQTLHQLKNEIQQLDVDDLRMNQQSLANALYKRKWINPFPKFKYTERPDTAAACLLEGKIVILVDNAPSAMILPTSVFDMIEEANDYYFPPITAVYLKIARALITIATIFLTPVYLLFMQNIQWVPEMFAFSIVHEVVNVPLILQYMILEVAIDGMRLAALNTPNVLSTPLSVIAGLVMGEFAVSSGWFNSEVMLGMAVVAVANYTQPNFELGYALKFMRLQLLILTSLFNIVGFIVGCMVVIGTVVFNRTLTGRNYMKVGLKQLQK